MRFPIVLTGWVTLLLVASEGRAASCNSASQYAPGQQAQQSGQPANQYAPGQQARQTGQTGNSFAPGQVKKNQASSTIACS